MGSGKVTVRHSVTSGEPHSSDNVRQYKVLFPVGFTVIVWPISNEFPFSVHVNMYGEEPPFPVASRSIIASAQITESGVKFVILKGSGSPIVDEI